MLWSYASEMSARDVLPDQSPARWKVYGDQDPQILAGGHSHVYSMLAALDQGRGPAEYRAAVAYSADLAGGPPGDPHYWDLLAKVGAGRRVVIVWNGNQHNAGFLLSPDPPFRVFSPLAEAGPEEGAWVAQEVLREYWRPTFSELTDVLKSLVPVARVGVVGTPPPKSDLVVRQSLAQEIFFLDRARELGVDVADLRITPQAVRLAMWHVIQDALEEIATEVGAAFIPVPTTAVDGDGTLSAEFCAPDATHANVNYGALMWKTISTSSLAGIRG